MGSRFFGRLGWTTAAALVLIVAWNSIPLFQSRLLGHFSQPLEVTQSAGLSQVERETIAAFNAAKDSVVFITTAERVRDPWTRNVYEVPSGSGSGFFWDDIGHVVTNYHVIDGASAALVRLADGRTFAAELVGTAPQHDLAVLRVGIPAPRPAGLPIGSSDDLQVGQSVLAIGNPFGLDWTLTTGIVSALDREIPGPGGRPITGLIQTDAAINPGNSGGPLIDSSGRLIGVNTAIYSPSGSSAGIGFAVPVDTVNRVVPSLIARGVHRPAQLGIRFVPNARSPSSATDVQGVAVLDIVEQSAAANAGLRPARLSSDGRIVSADVIRSIGGRPVEDAGDLVQALDAYRPGDTVEVAFFRDGELYRIDVTLQ